LKGGKVKIDKMETKNFWAFFAIALLLGLSVGIVYTSSLTTGNSIFTDLFKRTPTGITAPPNEGGGGGSQPGENGTQLATYRGVLRMLNSCKLSVTGDANSSCNAECTRQNIGVCINAYYIDYYGHMTVPYECNWLLGPGSNKALTCQCCTAGGSNSSQTDDIFDGCLGWCMNLGYSPESCQKVCAQEAVA
jgi:hypothetical protein